MKYYYENVEMEKALPARIYIHKSGSEDCHYPLHWHRDLEFGLVLEGNIIAHRNGEQVKVGAGDFFFVNSAVLHETDALDYSKLKTITIILSYQLMKEYCKDIDSIYFDLTGKNHTKQKIKDLILECGRTYEEKKKFYELDLSILLREMCRILLKECRRPKENRNSELDQTNLISIKRAMAYIEENYAKNITLEHISSEIGMSPTYFSRYFKKMTGQTFHSYLTNVRLYHAYIQLKDVDSSITQIAHENGFANIKSFIGAFKKVYHVTPERYRQINKIIFDNNKTEKDNTFYL